MPILLGPGFACKQAGITLSSSTAEHAVTLQHNLQTIISIAQCLLTCHNGCLSCSLMKQVTSCLLNAFRTSPLPPEPSPLFPNEAAIQTTAVAKLAQDTCTLQHHALNFVAALLTAEPATLKHLRAEGLWDLACGQLFFFWGGTDDGAHRHHGETYVSFTEGFKSLHTVHMWQRS